ncbi:MAG: FAD-dependent oxidoreductase [Planctomycetes bacterium]|nr:FAD-dependent oxidoreductase [Planctomycetota bacterium]
MPLLVRNIPLALEEPEENLPALVARRLRVPVTAIRHWAIHSRAIDARNKEVHFSYHIGVALDEPPKAERARLRRFRPAEVAWIDVPVATAVNPGEEPLGARPVVVGFGPGGMFAALRLAEMGYRPVVLERGREVRRRHRDIMQRFYRERQFDPGSNLLFGEGGAGTYSDGKLYTRVHDPLCRRVLEILYQHGADPDILINTRPHIGSDRLPTLCTRIRRHIETLGGEIRFETRLDDVRITDGRLDALRCGGAAEGWLAAGPVILSIGHSARDTVRMLAARGVRLEAKPFQIGVRIEHPQALVDHWQFGAAAGHARLGAAEYHLVARAAAGAWGDVFSFCMCPGGTILPSIESPGLLATNGASRARRSGAFANAGLVLTVDPARLGQSPLEALAWQEQWERRAFAATHGTYRLPCQRAADFMRQAASRGQLETSYPLGGEWCDLQALLPDFVTDALARALPLLEGKFPGFAGADALLTAPETRASAPVRVVRDPETREALGTAGLYPVGEGAGYAGGIISAAIDGIKTAETIIRRYAPPR